MNTKRLKRRLIKAIYKMNPRNVDIVLNNHPTQIIAVEKINKQRFLWYKYRDYSIILRGDFEHFSFVELAQIYETLNHVSPS